jgi:lysylphosphatidylglycerol synthetase-like protein (DUF2156 family)
MDAQRPIDSPTVQVHKRQLAWQILVPFLVATAVILGVAVLVASGSADTNRPWADVSFVLMIAPMLLVALMVVSVLGLLIYGIARLLKVTPKYTAKAQSYVASAAAGARKLADGSTKPVVWAQQARAVFKSIFKM